MTKPAKWFRSESGTRWQKKPEPPPPAKFVRYEPSNQLRVFLEGDASGDLELAILMSMRNLIRSPTTYTNAARATSPGGQSVEASSPDAVRWSMFGALEFVTQGIYKREQRMALLMFIKQCMPRDEENRYALFRWEQEVKHTKVLWLLNMAIAARKTAI